MNKRVAGVLVFALAVAGICTWFAYKFASRGNAQPKPVVISKVVVATRNLDAGMLIKESDVTLSDWGPSVPQFAILKTDDAIGRGVVSAIYAGEPLLDSRLAPKGGGAGLVGMLKPGERAVALRVNDVIGVGGFVLPGTHVDVLISGTPPNSPPTLGTVTRTLLQDIEVISVGQSLQRDAEGKPVSVQVLNLKVTPEQAELLSLANAETRVQLVLRNPVDKEIAKTPGTALGILYTGQKLALPNAQRAGPIRPVMMAQPKERPPVVVEVINGDKTESVKFKQEPED